MKIKQLVACALSLTLLTVSFQAANAAPPPPPGSGIGARYITWVVIGGVLVAVPVIAFASGKTTMLQVQPQRIRAKIEALKDILIELRVAHDATL